MDAGLRSRFLELWSRYFPGAELPLVFFHSDDPHGAEPAKAPRGWRCFIGDLAAVRRGKPMCYTKETVGCGWRYLGLEDRVHPHFDHFLSCGIPGQVEGERYKQSPEIVAAWKKSVPAVPPARKYIVFKRWDATGDDDRPEAVVFFATPDVLSGLYTWAGFDEPHAEAVAAPFGAGCASIVQYPLMEAGKERPRAILGMFDVSARPRVPHDVLSFAVPWEKFRRMIGNAGETFFITASWARVRDRIRRVAAAEGMTQD